MKKQFILGLLGISLLGILNNAANADYPHFRDHDAWRNNMHARNEWRHDDRMHDAYFRRRGDERAWFRHERFEHRRHHWF